MHNSLRFRRSPNVVDATAAAATGGRRKCGRRRRTADNTGRRFELAAGDPSTSYISHQYMHFSVSPLCTIRNCHPVSLWCASSKGTNVIFSASFKTTPRKRMIARRRRNATDARCRYTRPLSDRCRSHVDVASKSS